MTASWVVEYEDGTFLAQYDSDGKETPYRAIDWPRVRKLKFESQDVIQTFDVGPTPEGLSLSLRSRHFKGVVGDTVSDELMQCFMLVLSKTGEPVSEETVDSVLYWFPTGVMHDCLLFNCPDVSAYGSHLVHLEPGSLMPRHGAANLGTGAVLINQ